MFNTLEITEEVKRVNFKYTAQNYEFIGSCNITEDVNLVDINAQVIIKISNSPMAIGNCSSNGEVNVNIYQVAYKDKIDEVASYFKQLQSDLEERFIITPTND